ncbi:uncharacterized protein G2W53_041726 [Senna tora]|uniref:Uncharacterized protein n=1 Tax=Senna tora TaxID=362788 RepID=A0A834SE83_9FABA|nr:uncharacterized protein G2W53_041726 [Senna tora]
MRNASIRFAGRTLNKPVDWLPKAFLLRMCPLDWVFLMFLVVLCFGVSVL